MKVMMICNTDGALYNFRKPLISALFKAGAEVATVSGAGGYIDALKDMGVDARSVDFPRHSVSLISNIRLFFALRRSIRAARPDVVHCFTHKAAVFGTLAARSCGIRRNFVTITGLGTLFATDSVKNRVLRAALHLQYKLAMRWVVAVFFQNPDDLEEFVGRRIVARASSHLTGGSGVDLASVSVPTEAEVLSARASLAKEIGMIPASAKLVLLPARVVREKGIAEFYSAAKMINQGFEGEFRFVHIGSIDDLSTGAFALTAIIESARASGVHFLGFKSNVLDYMRAADIVVLPSYREGMPRSLLEALALGKIIVATDVPGCRETVRSGWNGYLCTVGDACSLASAIRRASAELGSDARFRARALAEEKFDDQLLVRVTLDAYAHA